MNHVIDLPNLHIPSTLGHPDWLESLIQAEALPSSFASLVIDFYFPLADSIAAWALQNNGIPLVIGINGAQGTGKSTLSLVMSRALAEMHQLKTVIISIDDIYLTKSERTQLSQTVHPLFITRGVPGTHDVALGIELIQKLKDRTTAMIPLFDKAMDDRAHVEKWNAVESPVDVIILEGWCVGACTQPADALAKPCNSLEESEDRDSSWRTYANEQLAGSYKDLFHLIDKLIMLKAPDFECVYQWRNTQEEKLRQRTAQNEKHSIMDDAQLKRFIMHYERLTHWMFEEMPGRVDCLLELNHDHNIIRTSYSQT